MKTVDEVVSRLQDTTTFSILDAKQGFWQLKLNDKSSRLCTLNTPIALITVEPAVQRCPCEST